MIETVGTRCRQDRGGAARRGTLLGLAAVTGLLAAVQHLGRTAGSTSDERRAELPGDELIPRPTIITDHAITIETPADRVWPWLTQVGWHRAGWYTPRWVDRLLFPANWPSPNRLNPELVRELIVGESIPNGPPGTAEFVIVQADPPTLLVLHSTTHLPASWRRRLDASIDWTWTFALTPGPTDSGRTRVHLRVRALTGPWFTTVYRLALVPADYIMGPGMLRGLRSRVRGAATSGMTQAA